MRVVLKPGGLLIVVLALLILGGVAFSRWGTAGSPAAPAEAKTTPVPKPAASPVPTNLARNADMSAIDGGGVLPAGWTDIWRESTEFTVRHDTGESHSAPASLLFDTAGKSVKGQVKQRIEVEPGARYRVSGYIKTNATDGTWSLAVQYDDATWNAIDFEHIGAPLPTSQWQKREAVVTVPKNATGLGVVIYGDGKGKAWLDDVSVTKEP